MDKRVNSIKEIDMSELDMPMVVITDHPKDYPNNYVGRIFDGVTPTNTVIIKDDVDELHEDIRQNTTMMFFPRGVEDDPCIVGVWM